LEAPSVAVSLTAHQEDAIDWLVTRLEHGAPLLALRGYAGTGKTTLIPALRAALHKRDIASIVGAPTHRAAMILRQKGIVDADTLHAQALTPYFTADYRRALAWLGDKPSTRLDGPTDEPRDDVDGLPWLVWQAVQPDLARARDLQRQRGRYPAKKLLASVGISGKDYFAGFGAKAGQGVLILDEASMVGQQLLTTCQQAFRQIVLVGDPGQLPPVKDTAMLETVPGFDLTEIHRQAQDSPILHLATRARQGEPWWQQPFGATVGDIPASAIVACAAVDAAQFLDAPLLVWRNVTRITCTHAIRHALGYEKTQLYVGEPLVCRSTSQEDRAEGFYNNSLYRITALVPDDPRRVTVQDPLGDTATVTVHLEEVDGDRVDPRAIPFRWGYCLTAHTAQGGEWPTVYLHMPDLRAYAAMCGRHERQADIAQWTYTAITRAKDMLGLLTQPQFLAAPERTMMADKKIAPPSAPLLGATPLEKGTFPTLDPPSATPPEQSPIPLLDDIDDPPVPANVLAAVTPQPVDPALPLSMQADLEQAIHESLQRALADQALFQGHEALLQGFCQHLQRHLETNVLEHHKHVMATLDAVCDTVRKWGETALQANEHSQYQLSDALLKVGEQGLALRHDPYTVRVEAMNQAGFAIAIQVAKSDPDELTAALLNLLAWLVENGFSPAPRGMAEVGV
jgi:exodeoxyribonuclease-5